MAEQYQEKVHVRLSPVCPKCNYRTKTYVQLTMSVSGEFGEGSVKCGRCLYRIPVNLPFEAIAQNVAEQNEDMAGDNIVDPAISRAVKLHQEARVEKNQRPRPGGNQIPPFRHKHKKQHSGGEVDNMAEEEVGEGENEEEEPVMVEVEENKIAAAESSHQPKILPTLQTTLPLKCQNCNRRTNVKVSMNSPEEDKGKVKVTFKCALCLSKNTTLVKSKDLHAAEEQHEVMQDMLLEEIEKIKRKNSLPMIELHGGADDSPKNNLFSKISSKFKRSPRHARHRSSGAAAAVSEDELDHVISNPRRMLPH